MRFYLDKSFPLPYTEPCVTQGAVPDIEINNLNDSG